MENMNNEGGLPNLGPSNLVPPPNLGPLNFDPQNPNVAHNPQMGGMPPNPQLNPAHNIGGEHIERRSVHGDVEVPHF